MPKVSVIVPVYNTEKYLKKCLDSLVKQTLKDIEIIVVNDGSLDNSQSIIDEYTKKYDFVKGYIKKNGGLSDARNYGIKKSHGKYIGFVDSDDYVNKDMFEKLYNKAVSQNFDVTVCNINIIGRATNTVLSSLVHEDINTLSKIKKQMINIYPVAWNKIYKRDLFENNIYFKKGVWYEDVEFLYRLFPYIKSFGTLDEALINYVERDNSITKTFDKRVYNYIDNWNGIIQFYKKNNFYKEYQEEIEYCYVRYLYATFIKAAAKFKFSEYKEACQKAKENVLKNFPNYKNNKYMKNIMGFYFKHFNIVTQTIIYILYHRLP